MDSTKYNSTGVASPQSLGSDSPPSNPGLVYQPANTPTNPGSLKAGTQTISTLTYQANVSGRRIRISMNDVSAQVNKDPGQNAGSIEIINADGNFVGSMGDNTDAAGTGEGIFNAQDLIGNPAYEGTRPFGLDFYVSGSYVATSSMLILEDDAENDLSPVARLAASTVSDGTQARPDFGYIFELLGGNTVHVYVSDGTTPNGVLTAPKGSVCFFSGSTGQIAYNTDGATAWSILGAGGSGNSSNIYAGSVVSNAAGTYFPVGWSVVHTGTGTYDIHHTLGTANFSAMITANGIVANTVAVYSKTTTQFSVLITVSNTSAPVDSDFDFNVTN